MDHHFRAFSFVDRIVSVQPGAAIHGRYTIPPGLTAFPSSLVAEATGQLAAWSAMAAINFQCRPVAGIAGRVELLGEVAPGQTLELSADLETADTESVAYRGEARVDGVPVLRLHDCVGPMVPMEDFDDPAAVRARYELLRDKGAVPGVFTSVPDITAVRADGEAGKWVRATLQVPLDAPFFGDHFARQSVFPGTLLMHANLQLVAALGAEVPAPRPAARWQLRTVSDMKLRAFIPPGELLEIEARLDEQTAGALTVSVETRKAKRVLGGARVELGWEEA